MPSKKTLVVADGWSVSSRSLGKPGHTHKVCRHVKTPSGKYHIIDAEVSGRVSYTDEEYDAIRRDYEKRGYLQPFVRKVWCLHCRVLHTFMGKPSSFCHEVGEFTFKMKGKGSFQNLPG